MSETAEFLQLSCVQIDVLYQTKQEMSLVTPGTLCRLVLDWIKRQLTEDILSVSMIYSLSDITFA